MRRSLTTAGLIVLGAICIAAFSVDRVRAEAGPATAPTTAPARNETFVLGGLVEKPGSWTVARLREEFKAELHPLSYESKGVKHQSQCVSLDSLLKSAQIRINTKRKSHMLALVVTVVARSGYAVSFSVSDLAPDVGNRAVWIALDADGAPLSDRDSPIKLIVPDDKTPARWIFGIATITVSDPTAPQ